MVPDDNDQDPSRASLAAAALPAAWLALVRRWDAGLLNLVAQEVVMRTGHWPDAEKVHEFLAGLATPRHVETVRTSETHPGFGGPSIYPPPRDKGAN